MNFWRAILASLLSLVCTLAVSAFVTLQTLNTTVFDRGEVKTWLVRSGVYDSLLATSLTTNAALQTQTAAPSISADSLKSSLAQTFPSSFVQASTEKALDATYNWFDGKQSSIQFDINTPPYKTAFIQNLSAALEPQLAAIPRCSSLSQFDSTNPACLPPGSSAKQAADSIAVDAANRSNLFDRPLSSNTLGQTNPMPQTLQQLPQIINSLRLWLIWLPLIAIVSGLLAVVLSRRRLKAAKHVSGRLTFSLAMTCILGLIIAGFGATMRLSDYVNSTSTVVVTRIVEPVLHQAAPAIGYRLALVSGMIGGITLVLWIIFRTLGKRNEKAQLLEPPADVVASPNKPLRQADPEVSSSKPSDSSAK